MAMLASYPRYHYFFLLHLKLISYWLGKKWCVNLHVYVSKELRILKATPRFTKNVEEMLKYRAKVKETLNYCVKSLMASC